MAGEVKQVAVIACAGWKGAGRGTPYVHLPAPFLPLPDGSTAAGRLAVQFKALGYEVALTVGPLGYPFRACQPRHEFRWSPKYAAKSPAEIAQTIGVDPDGSPWTEELYAYASSLGRLIVQPDPGWKSKHDSYCIAIDALPGYDRIVLARGDKLYETRFLEQMLATSPWPAQFALETFHAFFLLDREGIRIYRADAQNHRLRSTAERNWDLEMAKQPDGGEGTGRLDRAGIAHLGWHTPPWNEMAGDWVWGDMDHPPGYELCRRQVEKGKFA